METRGGISAFRRMLEEEQVRRRWIAVTAAVVFLACLLVVLGLGLVVLIAFGIAGSVASVWVARARSLQWPMPADAHEAATVETVALATGDDPAPPQSPLQAEGTRCNALGVALRRAGRAHHAATLHEAARLIFAGAGDRRGEALTANALGAALVEVGKPDAALEQFEQARTLLHALGDRHCEGKVLANIALAKRREGADEEAVDLLRSALEKLSPQTEAYRRVERQLARAS